MADAINHPPHYGGADNPYEAIKVIEAWKLGFHLGNAVKYIARAEKKYSYIEDLEKAVWYIQREIANRKTAPLATIPDAREPVELPPEPPRPAWGVRLCFHKDCADPVEEPGNYCKRHKDESLRSQ